MRVLVLGAYGMLGHKMVLGLMGKFDVYATCRAVKGPFPVMDPFPEEHIIPAVDVNDFDTVAAAMDKIRPEAVINCVGIIKQLEQAKDPLREC